VPFGVGLRRGFFFFLFLYLSKSLVCGFDPPPKTTQSQTPRPQDALLRKGIKKTTKAKKEQKFIFIRKGEWVRT
jgi:hypothetical protein